ncbi:MAG: IS110 family transposase [Erysipelotrichaceae bacterium]|nr:IS110 family transposase [Erysipelotrichaceae bacterium]
MKSKTKLYIQLTAALDRVFPELKPFLKKNLKTNIAHNLLKNYSTASEIEKVRVDKLYNVISHNTRQFSKARAESLKKLAQSSFGFHSDSLSKRIKNFINQIELIESQIDDANHLIVKHMELLDTPIIQIPGMGYIQAAYILSIIQNIQRFDSPCKVVAFAGIDPKIRQSGQFTASKIECLSVAVNFLDTLLFGLPTMLEKIPRL